MGKLWPILFHLAFSACPLLLALATHNYAAAATGAYSLVTSMLATLGIGGAGIASGALALVAHHKTVAQSTAALPPAAVVTNPGDRQKLLTLLWSDLGPAATDAELTAFKQMREASSKK